MLALLGTVALLARYAGLAAEQRTYEQAPGCETVTVTRHVSCRYGMSATVTAIDRYGRNGDRYLLTVSGTPPANGTVKLPGDACVPTVVGVGDTVHVQIWRGQIMRVGAVCSDPTLAQPRYPAGQVLAWVIAAGLIAVGLVVAWPVVSGWRLARAGWYRAGTTCVWVAAIAAIPAAAAITAQPDLPPALVYGIIGGLFGFAVIVVLARQAATGTGPNPVAASSSPVLASRVVARRPAGGRDHGPGPVPASGPASPLRADRT